MTTQKIDITQIIDAQKFRLFNFNLLFWTFAICFVDGYDFLSPAFIAPTLVKLWSLGPGMIAPIFTAAVVGIICGAPILGYVGDRYGRKKALVIGIVIFSILTFATGFVESLWQLVVMRFFTSMALGGVMSIAIVLQAEFAPRRLRATLVCIMFSGFTVGAGIPGVIAAWLVPQFGWQAVFFVGGIVPIILAVCVAIAVPESVKHLTLHPELHDQLRRLLKKIDPTLTIQPGAEFIISGEAQRSRISLKDLFAGPLRFMTPLLWIMASMIGSVTYFIQIWTPIMLTQLGASAPDAALAVTMFQVGGMIGVISMGLMFDRWGLRPILAVFAIAIPIVILLGTPGLAPSQMTILLFLAGFLTLGGLNGTNVLASVLYPTYMRGNGVGWAFGVGRVGLLLGAQVGTLREFLSMTTLFYIVAAQLILAALSALALGRYRGFGVSSKIEMETSRVVAAN